MSRTLAYIRVSTDRQDITKDRTQVEEYVERAKLPKPIVFYEDDGVSTKHHWRERKIGQLLKDMKPGDVLVSTEISRLARNMFQVMEIINECVNGKYICHIITPPLIIDDTPSSHLTSMLIGYAAQMEKELIQQRTKETLRIRREKGLLVGRPPGAGYSKLDVHRGTIEAWLKEGRTKASIARIFKTAPSNFYHWMEKRGIKIIPEGKAEKSSEWAKKIIGTIPM